MKITTNTGIYVQKNDINYLNTTNLNIPPSIYIEYLRSESSNTTKNNFIKFEDKDDIRYFKNLDWIIEYNDVINLTENEIIELQINIAKEQENIVLKYNSLTKDEKIENMDLINECKFLAYKFDALKEIILYKQGLINIELPEEVNEQNIYTYYKKKKNYLN